MKARVTELREQGDKLFSSRLGLHGLWQTTAENFYPERADFTRSRALGDEFASHLMTGFPVMARRDLANTFSTMLRPRGSLWFHGRTGIEQIDRDSGSRRYLDWASERLRRVMYDNKAHLVRATKQGDNDFATFGQCVISIDPRQNLDGLLYRAWHLRDTAWCENAELEIDTLHRNWNAELRTLFALFPNTVKASLKSELSKNPYREVKCRHILLPADDYDLKQDGGKKKLPFVSIYIDCENETILEEKAVPLFNYVIPRWVTVSGSQYAYSPASVVALPDARLLQQITLTLLEAGQKAVDPPVVAVGEAIQGGINLFAGGATYVDAEYDERMGEVLRPLMKDAPGLNWGVDRENRIAEMIKEAFYLNQISLPDPGEGDMTAYETQKRIEEYVRRALPLFEPLETEYNAALCDKSFEVAQKLGAFGSPQDMPQELQGREVKWQFESPLQATAARAKTQSYLQAAELLKVAVEIDPDSVHDFNNSTAFRDALEGTGAPADWIVPPKVAAQSKEQAAQARQAAALAQTVNAGAEVAGNVGEAAQQLEMAGI
jgi:hypothetical protein